MKNVSSPKDEGIRAENAHTGHIVIGGSAIHKVDRMGGCHTGFKAVSTGRCNHA